VSRLEIRDLGEPEAVVTYPLVSRPGREHDLFAAARAAGYGGASEDRLGDR
jgi:hypothetical protein